VLRCLLRSFFIFKYVILTEPSPNKKNTSTILPCWKQSQRWTKLNRHYYSTGMSNWSKFKGNRPRSYRLAARLSLHGSVSSVGNNLSLISDLYKIPRLNISSTRALIPPPVEENKRTAGGIIDFLHLLCSSW
jgi:hypothetical protein